MDLHKIALRITNASYQPTLTGILKLSPQDKISELQKLQTEVIEKYPDLKPLPEDKLHITMLHQSKTKPLKQMELPPFEGSISFGDMYSVEREGKKSVFVLVNEQDELRSYVQSLGVEPEPQRKYHVSLANLTGGHRDSVGHTEEIPIMSGATKLE